MTGLVNLLKGIPASLNQMLFTKLQVDGAGFALKVNPDEVGGAG